MPITAENLRRVAVLVASLDTETADQLLDQFGADADAIRRVVVELDDIDPQEQQAVIAAFMAHCGAPNGRHRPEPHRWPSAASKRPSLRDRPDRARDISQGRSSTYPQSVQESDDVELSASLAQRLGLAQDNHAPAEQSLDNDTTPFRFLRRRSGAELAAILAGEHPQTVALVLSHAADEVVPRILAALPAAMQPEVLRRLLDFDEAHPEILREVERGLESRMTEHTFRDSRRRQRLEQLRLVLAAAAPEARDEILDNLEQHDPALAGSLRPTRREPVFAELLEKGDRFLLRTFSAVEPSVRLIALAGAPPALVERIARQLPVEEARTLRRTLLSMGPLRLSDVDQAQKQVAEKAQEIEAEERGAARTALAA